MPDVDSLRQRARDRVLHLLKTRGTQTAGELARRLEITSMGVRQHLAALEQEGLVEYRDERRGVGRPRRVWALTEAAASRFPDSHADLAVELIAAMRRTFGADGVDRLVASRSRQQLKSYRARMPAPDAPLAERVAALAALRSDEGYMADWSEQDDGSFLLVENHCPICAAARLCQGLCRDELALFGKTLGRDVRVERTEHILAGARRCAYEIRKRRPKGAARSEPKASEVQ